MDCQEYGFTHPEMQVPNNIVKLDDLATKAFSGDVEATVSRRLNSRQPLNLVVQLKGHDASRGGATIVVAVFVIERKITLYGDTREQPIVATERQHVTLIAVVRVVKRVTNTDIGWAKTLLGASGEAVTFAEVFTEGVACTDAETTELDTTTDAIIFEIIITNFGVTDTSDSRHGNISTTSGGDKAQKAADRVWQN